VCRCLYCNLTVLWAHARVALLGNVAVLFLVFGGGSRLFSIMAILIYLATNSVWGFLFPPTSSSKFVLVCVLDDSYWISFLILHMLSTFGITVLSFNSSATVPLNTSHLFVGKILIYINAYVILQKSILINFGWVSI
jgi:hypothetical protein